MRCVEQRYILTVECYTSHYPSFRAVKVDDIRLDFSVNGTDDSIVQWLEREGFEVVSKWAMGSSLDEIRSAAEADVDLVVSASGIGAAEVLYERFGIPNPLVEPAKPAVERVDTVVNRNLILHTVQSKLAARDPVPVAADQRTEIGAELLIFGNRRQVARDVIQFPVAVGGFHRIENPAEIQHHGF